MRRRHFWLLVATCLMVISLTLANFLTSVRNRDDLRDSIQDTLIVNQAKNEETIKRLVQEYVAKVEVPVAREGEDGRDGKDGESIVGPAGKPGKDGKNGQDGKNGEGGQPGIPGREIELATDEYGTILWRYTGDDFWTVIEVVEVL